MTLAVGIWLWVAYRYQDVNELNHQLLLNVREQNAEIKALLQSCMLAWVTGVPLYLLPLIYSIFHISVMVCFTLLIFAYSRCI